MVVAANDVGDLHQRVVDGDDIVVDRNAGRDTAGRPHQDTGSLTESLGKLHHRRAPGLWKRSGRSGNLQANGKRVPPRPRCASLSPAE